MKLANYGLKPLTGASIYFSILDSSQTFIFNNSSKNCVLCRSQCLSRFLFKIPGLDNRILLAYLPFIKVLHHWLSIRETSATSPFSLISSLSRSITAVTEFYFDRIVNFSISDVLQRSTLRSHFNNFFYPFSKQNLNCTNRFLRRSKKIQIFNFLTS